MSGLRPTSAAALRPSFASFSVARPLPTQAAAARAHVRHGFARSSRPGPSSLDPPGPETGSPPRPDALTEPPVRLGIPRTASEQARQGARPHSFSSSPCLELTRRSRQPPKLLLDKKSGPHPNVHAIFRTSVRRFRLPRPRHAGRLTLIPRSPAQTPEKNDFRKSALSLVFPPPPPPPPSPPHISAPLTLSHDSVPRVPVAPGS